MASGVRALVATRRGDYLTNEECEKRAGASGVTCAPEHSWLSARLGSRIARFSFNTFLLCVLKCVNVYRRGRRCACVASAVAAAAAACWTRAMGVASAKSRRPKAPCRRPDASAIYEKRVAYALWSSRPTARQMRRANRIGCGRRGPTATGPPPSTRRRYPATGRADDSCCYCCRRSRRWRSPPSAACSRCASP